GGRGPDQPQGTRRGVVSVTGAAADHRLMSSDADPVPGWFEALESRHLSRLTFAEVRRGLQALSALYVDRGRRLGAGAALEGAGKRAAFALFYTPLHFLLTRSVVRALGAQVSGPRNILDLGCGTGAA